MQIDSSPLAAAAAHPSSSSGGGSRPAQQQQQQQQQQQPGGKRPERDQPGQLPEAGGWDAGGELAPCPAPPPAAPPVPDFLQRQLQQLGGAAAASGHQLLALAVHAAVLESGLAQAAPMAPRGKGLLGAEYLLPGAAGAEPVRCGVRCLELGPHLVVHATAAATARAAPSGSGGPALARTLHLRVDEHVRAAAAPAGAGAGALFPRLPATWRLLKDQAALPLLLAACCAAGRGPPFGLLALPQELQTRVLEALPAQALAALAAACAPLRHLAAADVLWRGLFEREWPQAGRHEAQEAERHGYKWAFGRRWAERARRQRHRRLPPHAMMPVPFPGPMPFGPARRPPFMPPGVVGGDYDRLPGGALPGGGPGMFPGGGGALGAALGGGPFMPGFGPPGQGLGPGLPGQLGSGRRGSNFRLH
jgi:hypothetical protein